MQRSLLGELMLEAKIKYTGFRVGAPEANGSRLELDYVEEWEGRGGPLAGVKGRSMGTATGIQRPDGVWVGEGHGISTTNEGQRLPLSWQGISVPTGPGKIRVRAFVLFRISDPKFQSLNSTCWVWEEDGDLNRMEGYGKAYEWK